MKFVAFLHVGKHTEKYGKKHENPVLFPELTLSVSASTSPTSAARAEMLSDALGTRLMKTLLEMVCSMTPIMHGIDSYSARSIYHLTIKKLCMYSFLQSP